MPSMMLKERRGKKDEESRFNLGVFRLIGGE